MQIVETKKKTECEYAICDNCEFEADDLQPFWSVQKSIGLHNSGCPTHKVRMFKRVDQDIEK